MRTYQNLSAIRESEGKLKKFVFDVIEDHKGSAAYKTASVAEKYYAKKNVTIMAFQKMLYNMHGQEVPDMWSANYKLRKRSYTLRSLCDPQSHRIQTFSACLRFL